MNTERKYKWALTGLIIMILLNAGTLFMLWGNNPDNNDLRERPRQTEERGSQHDFMKKELGLSDLQADSITALRRAHFREVRGLRRDLNQMRRQYFDMLMSQETGSEAGRDSLIRQMGKQYMAIERSMHLHMEDLNTLLDEEQQEKFGQMMKEMFTNQRGRENSRGQGPRWRNRD